MRALTALCLLSVIIMAAVLSLSELPFGANHIAKIEKPGRGYLAGGVRETGAANTVTSVVVTYRGFDTLGEVTVLFIAAIGLSAVLYTRNRPPQAKIQEASFILKTGCCFLFPLIIIFGAYIFIHGHLTPGGGFQGGVITASGFLLVYFGCAGEKIPRTGLKTAESLAGVTFITAGLSGLVLGGSFLMNFMPKGTVNTLWSAGLIPVIYIAIGFKVGSELAGVVADLLERQE